MSVIVGVLALAVITLNDVMRMSPGAAGELLLKNKPHGEIVSIDDPSGPFMLPGYFEKILRERPEQRGLGCVRRSWSISFYADNDRSRNDALLSDVHSYEEVQLSSVGGCRGERWVHVNGGDTERALSALDRFSAKLSGEGRLVESCRDETPSQLCANEAATLQGLKSVFPWLAGVRDGKDYIGLAGPDDGGFATEVTLGEHVSDGMIILRKIPDPF